MKGMGGMFGWVKILLSRLFCLHQWEIDYSHNRYLNGMSVYGQGVLKSWICKRCKSQVYSYVEPISFYDFTRKEI